MKLMQSLRETFAQAEVPTAEAAVISTIVTPAGAHSATSVVFTGTKAACHEYVRTHHNSAMQVVYSR